MKNNYISNVLAVHKQLKILTYLKQQIAHLKKKTCTQIVVPVGPRIFMLKMNLDRWYVITINNTYHLLLPVWVAVLWVMSAYQCDTLARDPSLGKPGV
jgi:hypothetical protein